MHRRWPRVLAAVFVLSLVAAACGGDDTTSGNGGGGSPSEGGGGGGADLTIVDFAFSPKDLSVTEGQRITVTNNGSVAHNFTTDDGTVDETVSAGETEQITLTGVKSGGFHCRFHPQMTGTLTVG